MASPAPKPVVKNGKFYHVYNYGQPNERWVYIRDAAGTEGVVRGPSDSSLSATGPAKGALAPTGTATAPALQPAAAGAPPAAPGLPMVDPFLSGADLTEVANFNFEDTSARADIDRALADLAAQTGYDKRNVEDTALRNKVGTTDDMIARGLFQSSIKDGAVADIEKNRVLQQGQLDDRLRIATTDADARKKALDARAAAFQSALAARAVENARTANDANAAAAPAPAAPPAPASAAAAPKPYKPVVRNGKFYHVYPDGREVYIRPASGSSSN